jgi:hypothetical protein
MKPLKTGLALANWVLRISLLLFILLIFIGGFRSFNFGSREFYFSSIYIICAILLFFGGFLSKSSLTVISGLIIAVLSFAVIFFHFSGRFDIEIANYLIIMSIGFYFVCTGN